MTTLECSSCERAFEPSPREGRLLAAARAKKMPFVMFKCPNCESSVKVVVAAPARPEAQTTPFRCPAPHCAGWLADIGDLNSGGSPQHWGCGECGRTWAGDKALQSDITAILKRYTHRTAVYKKGPAGWVPIDLARQPKDYEATIETEARR